MFELFVLGSARIEGKHGRLTGEPAQRHRLALLALLAAARDATMPREKLMALLWPDHGDREARHLLNVALHVLRKALGDDVIRSEGDDLRLDTRHLPSDIVRFREAMATGDLTSAAAAYGGRFLDGFFLDDCPDFEQWQEAERWRLEGEFMAAMEKLAETAEQAGDWAAALRWWQAVSTRAPDRARVTVRLMRALEATGDRTGALRVADAHSALLAREFAAEPSPDVTALAARMRGEPTGITIAAASANSVSGTAPLSTARRAHKRLRGLHLPLTLQPIPEPKNQLRIMHPQLHGPIFVSKPPCISLVMQYKNNIPARASAHSKARQFTGNQNLLAAQRSVRENVATKNAAASQGINAQNP
jgi:DNA-binding SARP family transcriptional activator